jgi:predicted ABC-type ATPase
MIMFAGPNGSGKTTLMKKLKQRGFDFGHYINPDDIALTLQGSYEARVREAQKIADDQRAMCLKNKTSFSFETVMSHPSKIDVLKQAHERDFRTTLFYVSTENPDINVMRVKHRVSLGGHDVPESKIRERYYKSLNLLPEAIAHSDVTYLRDSSFGNQFAKCEIRYKSGILKIKDEQFFLLPLWMHTAIMITAGMFSKQKDKTHDQRA